MTDIFKDALNKITSGEAVNVERQSDDCRMLIYYLGTITTKNECWAIHETIKEALTLATEAEQLRKERDELAKAYVCNYPAYGLSTGEESYCYKLAKRIIENGTPNTANKS